MKIRHFVILVFSFALFVSLLGCTTTDVKESRRISTVLGVFEYDSGKARYEDRMAYVSIQLMKDGSRVLAVSLSRDESLVDGSPFRPVRFYSQDCDRYVAAIDSFLNADINSLGQRGFRQRPIAVVKSSNGAKLSFDIFSTSPEYHLLSIAPSGSGIMGNSTPPLMMNYNNAVVLRRLITDLSR